MTLRSAPVATFAALAVGAGALAAAVPSMSPAASVTTATLFGGVTPKYGPSPEVAKVELGTSFTSSQAGSVTQLRFYKHKQNIGTHLGRLYDSAGRLLASATYTGETASGWQTVRLSQPVSILAGRSYTVSYTTSGRYASDWGYFSKGPRPNGALTATRGTYRYGSGYPTTVSKRGANYYADVVVSLGGSTPTATTTSATPSATSTTTAGASPTSSTTAPATSSAPATTSSAPTTTSAAPPTTSSTPPPTTAPPTTSSSAPAVSYPRLSYYQRFANGPRYTSGSFPYGVWMQDPTKEADTTSQWKSLGVNTYVGIWNWPTDSGAYPGHVQDVLDAFAASGAQAVAGYTGQSSIAATQQRNGDTVRSSLLTDEPDMDGTTAAQLASQASAARTGDKTRPTYVNFSKGIVNGFNLDKSLSPADKQAYCASADIASVDFYGFTDPWENYPGATGYARAMDAMRAACGADKPIWAFVETTRPFSDGRRITADQFEAAVWTALASGADGIELFIHDFGPNGWGEDALLRDPAAADVKARVGVVGSQLRAAAPVLNEATRPASSTNANVRALGKQGGVIAMNMATTAQTTTVKTSCAPGTSLQVQGENRTVTVGADSTFTDGFAAYQHRLYQGSC